MNSIDFSEKRQYARVALKCRVVGRIEEEGPFSKEFTAIGKNLSAEGILFTSKKQFTTGNTLSLQMSFPDESAPIAIRGKVKWCVPLIEAGERSVFFDTGVWFLNLDRNHLRILIKYVCGNLIEDLNLNKEPL